MKIADILEVRLLNKLSEEEQIAAVQQIGYLITFINSPSEAVQLAAVQKNGSSIGYIKNPSEAVQLVAVKNHAWVIQSIQNPTLEPQLIARLLCLPLIEYIKNPTERVQLVAISHGGSLHLIKNPSEAVQLAAVQQNGWAIRHIKNPSEAVQLAAVQQAKDSVFSYYGISDKDSALIALLTLIKRNELKANTILYYVLRHTFPEWEEWAAIDKSLRTSKLIKESDHINEAVTKKNINKASEAEQIAYVTRDPTRIKYITNPTEAVQLAAVKQNRLGIKYITNPSEAVQLAAVKHDGTAIDYITNPSEAVQLAAVQQDGYAIEYIRNPSETIQLAAIKQRLYAIRYIKNPTEAVQLAAIQRCPLDYIRNPVRIDLPGIKALILKPILTRIKHNQLFMPLYNTYKDLYPEWEEWKAIDKSLRASKLINDPINEAVTLRNVIDKSLRASKLIKESQNADKIPEEVWEFLDSLNANDVGKERIGDYIVHFEGFSEECQNDAAERTQLPASDPRHLQNYDDVYDEVIGDFISRENGNKPVSKGMVGDEFFPIVYAVFHKPIINEGQLNRIDQFEYDGGSLEGYVVDTNQPQLENYLTAQGARQSLIKALQSRYKRIGIVRNMWVDEELRGGGIGSDMLKAAIGDAFSFGADAVLLVADRAEDNSHLGKTLDKWYEGFGFRTIGSASGDPVMVLDGELNESWSKNYKKSINCSHPKGFSQKAHCAGRRARQAGKHTKSKSVSEQSSKSSGLNENIVDRLYDLFKNGCIDNALTELTYAVFREDPSLNKDMVIDIINNHKIEILKFILLLFRNDWLTMENKRYIALPFIRALNMLGIDWPELAIIKKSLKADSPTWWPDDLDENFADGKGPGRPGDSQRHGIPKGATIAQLEKAAKAPGRKGQLARWQLNMRRGRAKNESLVCEGTIPASEVINKFATPKISKEI